MITGNINPTEELLKTASISSRVTSSSSMNLGGEYPFLNHEFCRISGIVIRWKKSVVQKDECIGIKCKEPQTAILIKHQLTVFGLGSSILHINCCAPAENHFGHVKSAL